ncbi:sensor histidine kinase [Undibacterium fentianense]|uniref:histidine kinase n=1 Tax=Undibacterium fentianense TaxID=2828728 RepID=A0A941IH51_9BURK|nr:hypothetical protein [Undibacterium fentianense]MBR7800640.1 hypothetical protein [Undibacterium fentianense]
MALIVSIVTSIVFCACWLVYHQPSFNAWVSYEKGLLVVKEKQVQSSSKVPRLWRIQPSKQDLINPILFTRDPDQLTRFDDQNRLFSENRRLAEQIQANGFVVFFTGDQDFRLEMQKRTIQDIPWNFYFQVVCGALALLIGGAVWSLNPRSIQTITFFLCSLGFCLISNTLAVYSSRELVMDTDQFFFLAALNRFATYLLVFSGTILFWYFPRRLHQFPFPIWMSVLGGLAYFNERWQVIHMPFHDYQAIFIFVALVVLMIGIAQWRKQQLDAVERAALRWVSFSFAFSFSSIVLFYVLPNMLAPEWSMNLDVASLFVLSVFVGVALGISRYRLFDLEQWWYQIWLWFLCGMLIIVVDFAMMSLLHLGSTSSITMTIVLVGWLYFPLRQRLLLRFRPKNESKLTALLPVGIEFLMKPYTPHQLEVFWLSLLKKTFRPLSVELSDVVIQSVQIAQDGVALSVPRLTAIGHVELRACSRGQRLFNRDDLKLTTQLLSLLKFGHQQNQVRQQSASRERDRIMRDLHDEVCANLLTMIHCTDDLTSAMARSTLQSLRETIYSLKDDCSVELRTWLNQMRHECIDRCVDFDLDLGWQVDGATSMLLSARQQVNLSRILGEILTNAFKHADASFIQFHFVVGANQLSINVVDNGKLTQLPNYLGNGWLNLRRRCAELDGELRFEIQSPHGLRIRIQVPLEETNVNGSDLRGSQGNPAVFA